MRFAVLSFFKLGVLVACLSASFYLVGCLVVRGFQLALLMPLHGCLFLFLCVLSVSPFFFLLTPAGGDAVDHGLPPGQAPEEVLQEQAPRLALFFITCCQGCHPSCWLL